MHEFLRQSLASGKLDEGLAEYHTSSILGTRGIIQDKLFFKLLFEEELFNDAKRQRFSFNVVELPLIEVATAIAAFPLRQTLVSTSDPFDIKLPNLSHKPGTDIAFMNLIPTKDKLVMILGCTKVVDNGMQMFYQGKSLLRGDALFSFISHFLIRSTKSWTISPSFYKRIVHSGKDKVIIENMRHYYVPYIKNYSLLPDFNMFEGEY
jgi:hypothetical protein